MDYQIKKKIDEQIDLLIERLSAYPIESKERKAVMDEIEALHALRIEEIKTDISKKEIEIKVSEMEQDRALKEIQANNQRFDNAIDNATKIIETLLNIIAYDIWNRRGLKFEMTGTVGSLWTRNLMSKMLPKK